MNPNAIEITKTDDDGYPLEARVPSRCSSCGRYPMRAFTSLEATRTNIIPIVRQTIGPRSSNKLVTKAQHLVLKSQAVAIPS